MEVESGCLEHNADSQATSGPHWEMILEWIGDGCQEEKRGDGGGMAVICHLGFYPISRVQKGAQALSVEQGAVCDPEFLASGVFLLPKLPPCCWCLPGKFRV